MGIRLTTSGAVIGWVRREARRGTRGNGQNYETPAGVFLLLAQNWDSYPTRVSLSDAQAAELDNPNLFGRTVEVQGSTAKDGYNEIIECASYAVDPMPANGDHAGV